MIGVFHFLRVYWLLALLPFACLTWYLLKRVTVSHAWQSVCDEHLLPHLIQTYGRSKRTFSLLLLLMSAVLMIISLAGPTWSRLPVPIYQQIQPRVLVLDLSDVMQERDLSPDRLSRAKFKLHDLLHHHDVGQFGLVVYTEQPFVVSPLTDDGQTIDELLAPLSPDIMPVQGNRLDRALEQAQQLIVQSGAKYGQILVMTANIPDNSAIATAEELFQKGVRTSVMPVLKGASHHAEFANLAHAGGGSLLLLSDTSADLEQWLQNSKASQEYEANMQNEIPIWRDQGRWFLIPAMLLMLPIFRRGWLQRIRS
jgi:Ca-activated chloride channel family protein